MTAKLNTFIRSVLTYVIFKMASLRIFFVKFDSKHQGKDF